MPPLPPPNTLAQLEEACRRLEEVSKPPKQRYMSKYNHYLTFQYFSINLKQINHDFSLLIDIQLEPTAFREKEVTLQLRFLLAGAHSPAPDSKQTSMALLMPSLLSHIHLDPSLIMAAHSPASVVASLLSDFPLQRKML